MPPAITRILILLWHTPEYFKIMVASAVYAAVHRWWVQRKQRLLSEASRGWPTHRGRVVAVQAVRDGRDDQRGGMWSGLLTYSYIIDEVEIGEYRQPFSSEAEADEWVRALREKTVTVAVDPADKRRSIWVQDEATAAKDAAVKASLEDRAVTLPGWLEAVRLGALSVAVVGTLICVALEAHELLVVFGYAPASTGRVSGYVPAGAAMCFGIAAYVFAKRYPGSNMDAIGSRFQGPVINVFLKGLGLVEGTLLFWLWLRYSDGNILTNTLVSRVIFSGVWGGLFAGAAVTLWVAGRRVPQTHGLAPEGRGPVGL
jgi:hypothetical protein